MTDWQDLKPDHSPAWIFYDDPIDFDNHAEKWLYVKYAHGTYHPYADVGELLYFELDIPLGLVVNIDISVVKPAYTLFTCAKYPDLYLASLRIDPITGEPGEPY